MIVHTAVSLSSLVLLSLSQRDFKLESLLSEKKVAVVAAYANPNFLGVSISRTSSDALVGAITD